jgi:hypothetical protein
MKQTTDLIPELGARNCVQELREEITEIKDVNVAIAVGVFT